MAIDAKVTKQVKGGVDTLLSDGKWHPFGQFISIADCVPPERATRAYLGSRSDGGGAEKPIEEQISRGRRRVIRQRLNQLLRGKQIEAEGEGFDTKYRLIGFNMAKEAIKAGEELIARQSTEHLKGVELKDYLITAARFLLIKATGVKV